MKSKRTIVIETLLCPRCGTPKERDVFVGMTAKELGPKFYCGTIYWPSKNKVTVIGVACKIICELQEKIDDLDAFDRIYES